VLTDGRSIPANTVLEVDLCIIGSGPAGISVARELIGSGYQILMLERGDVAEQPVVDLASDLEFVSPHFPSPHQALHYQFGGMAAIWNVPLLDGVTPAARFLPLDPIDFETRSWVPHSGWPITFEDLVPYYDRARALCGLGPFHFHGSLPETGRPPLSTPSGALVTGLDQLGPATAFTSRPLNELTTSDHVRVVTNASAVDVKSADHSDDGMATTSVRTQGGLRFAVRSRLVIVAAGAIESARLLLNSTAEWPTGLGNCFDNVGRFFMDHPRLLLGVGSVPTDGMTRCMDLYEPHVVDGQLLFGKLKLSDAVLRREELLNGNAQIFPHYLSIPQLKAVRSARVVTESIRQRKGLTRVPKHFTLAARHSISMARYALTVRYLNRPDVPGPNSDRWTGVTARSFKLTYQPEQAPNPVNRVSLSERRDRLGYRIAHLDWRWSDIDLRSIGRARQLFASELQASGLGDLVELGDDVVPRAETAHHHLGTTRMHDSPSKGVVDRDCRLHGSSSVYMAGGSVFPTGGYANPTLTIVALAIRLADELKRLLSTP
jgi:choline dehydrogenase-like flavoprotein